MQINKASDSKDYQLSYRADIEGLRAVAILLVVAAHAKTLWLAGGFVGVDVFFVLSGYLITGLLIREIGTTGHIRFANFYARRFRRLLPMLLLMLACTSVAAVILIPPSEQGSQATAAASASVWMSNFYFALSKLDYFGPNAASSLFLHTWSLGVEEQFYLAWPALLLLACRQHESFRQLNTLRLKIIMFVIVGISLMSCVRLTPHAPQLAFYMMPLRAWQFAIGALTMLFFQRLEVVRINGVMNETTIRNPAISEWIGWVGLGLILTSAVLLNANTTYPGSWALLPSIGAACVLAAGVGNVNRGVSTLLSIRPLQTIGRISYAWYLWHWPVLLLGATVVSFDNPINRLLLVVISLVLAIISHRLIEAPIRRNAKLVMRPSAMVLTAIVLMVTANVLSIRWYNAVSNWMSQPEQQRYLRARTDAPAIYGMGCDDWYHSADVHICEFGSANAEHTAVLMGDSVGLQWFPAVTKVFDKPDWRLLVLTKSSCPMVDEPLFYSRIGREYVECAQWRNQALRTIQALKPDILLLGSTATYAFTSEQWTKGTQRVLLKISPYVRRIYLIRATPILPFNGPSCISGTGWLTVQLMPRPTCRAASENPKAAQVYNDLLLATKSFKNIKMIDLNNSVCPNGECVAELRGQIVFRDNQHLTASFVASLANQFKKQIDLNELYSGPGAKE